MRSLILLCNLIPSFLYILLEGDVLSSTKLEWSFSMFSHDVNGENISLVSPSFLPRSSLREIDSVATCQTV